MPKFTQGSWIFHDEYILTANKGRIIADVMATHNKDEFNANGRLIASAPEMYEELCEALEFFNKEEFYSDEAKTYVKSIKELLARIDEE